MKLEFYRHIFENYPNRVFMKICRVGAELFHAEGCMDRQTDRYSEVNSFSQFCESATKCEHLSLSLCVILLFEQLLRQIPYYIALHSIQNPAPIPQTQFTK